MTTEIDPEVAADVALAAKIMDERKPGWFRRIVWKRLNMSMACDCIAGQSGLNWEDVEDEFVSRSPRSLTAPFADEATVPAWQVEVRARRRHV